MQAKLFAIPQVLNMGFHYTLQFSRRTRVNVIGLVDQSTDEWAEWYLKVHEPAALREMADAGYTLIEIHFLYGFGLEGEREEWERARDMTRHAHAAGLKVQGYFQFFSVQQELFFLENPWARDCIQVNAEGKRIQFRYDRPALCFTDERVRRYYMDGIELGLKTCDLDGIRLDNDYIKGCYCKKCQDAFRGWLREKFPVPAAARRVFGLSTTDGMDLAPIPMPRDPLWHATVLFRQEQRQKMMRQISEKIRAIKPDAILGGNPGCNRRFDDAYRIHIYTPDLAETHHLVCAENIRYPARTGGTIRHQALLYKHGQAGNFAVFASHHLHNAQGRIRWPDTLEECALSLCEALAFGGHPVCTTWGIRMDAGGKILYQRPLFRKALDPVAAFLKEHGAIYRGAQCDASIGIYQNRESLCGDSPNSWLSLQGAVQILLQRQIPFRLVDRDTDELLNGIKLLVVPDMQLISEAQMARLRKFADAGGKLLWTGQAGRFDDWRLKRDTSRLESWLGHANIAQLPHAPEKISRADEHGNDRQFAGEGGSAWYMDLPMPPSEQEFTAMVKQLAPAPAVTVSGSPFVTLDTFANGNGEHFAHLLNYDNANPCDLTVGIAGAGKIECFMPAGLGTRSAPSIRTTDASTAIMLKGLHTYCVIKY